MAGAGLGRICERDALVYWAIQLPAYTPWALRLLRVAQATAPILAGLGVGWAIWTGSAGQTASVVLFGICLAASLACDVAVRGSLAGRARARPTRAGAARSPCRGAQMAISRPISTTLSGGSRK